MTSTSDDQQYSSTDPNICRDFLRNVCKRGRKCKFVHPCQDECERLRRSKRIFCHDYQNSTCRRSACKFLHYSREEEEIFRRTGRLPNEVTELSDSTSKLEEPPICKDYLNGVCSRGTNCKYRHLNNPDERTQPAWSGAYSTIIHSTNLPTTATLTLPITTFQGSIDQAKVVYSSIQPNYHTSALLALSTPAQSSQFQNTPILNSTITPTSGSLLKSGNEVFVSTSTSAPLIGVIDGTPNRQTALYPHTPALGTLNSLVSVTNTSQASSCSSMLALAPDSNPHPTLLHTGAIPNAHTTYLLSNSPSHLHHHLLTTGAPHSHAPTLLTIPLPQFPCDGSSGGTLIHPQTAVSCTTQHPAVLTGMMPSNTSLTNSTTYYPYNVVHINPTPLNSESVVSNLSKHNLIQEADRPLEVTSSVSSPSTAVLAAAAAAGYLAQHMPGITSNTNATPADHGKNQPAGSSKALDVHETAAIAAAANLPTVSAAAAAAVAAAAAFAHSTSMTAQNVFSNHGSNYCTTLFESDSGKTESSSTSGIPNGDCQSGKLSNRSIPKQDLIPCSTASSISTTEVKDLELDSTDENNSMSRDLSTFRCNTNPEYLHQQDDHAKTAAAVAAAACIGAMFSQPMAAAANPGSSSVAAMLDNLMGRNSQNPNQSTHCPSPSRHSCLTDDTSSSNHTVSNNNNRHELSGKMNEAGLQERTSSTTNEIVDECESYSSAIIPSASRHNSHVSFNSKLQTSNSQEVQYPVRACASSSNWSSVATTMASAAKAAAAAAVAATAAVTGSANFFRLKHFQDKLNPQLQECFLDRVSRAESLCCTTSSLGPHVSHGSDQYSHHRSDSESITSSLPNKPSLNNLSTKAAVTMTSAAAAAAMVAAAATVAAEQQHLIGSNFLSELDQPKASTLGFSSKKKMNRSPVSHARFSRSKLTSCHPLNNTTLGQDMYATEDSDYTPSRDNKHFVSKRRKKNLHDVDPFGYTYSHSTLCNDTEEYDDDGDVFEEDDLESNVVLTPSPEVTPPYHAPSKLNKLSNHLNLRYGQQTDESRPASCDTSPSDLLQEPDAWEDTTRLNSTGLNSRIKSSCMDSGGSLHHSFKEHRKGYPSALPDARSDDRRDIRMFSSPSRLNNLITRRRSLSETCSNRTFSFIILKRRSNSHPNLIQAVQSDVSEVLQPFPGSSCRTANKSDFLTGNLNQTRACVRKVSNKHFDIPTDYQRRQSKFGNKHIELRRKHYRLSRPFSPRISRNFSTQSSSFMMKGNRTGKAIVGPISSEVDSGPFRDDDTEFADFDYSDDDTCSITSRRLALKRMKSMPPKRPPTKKGNILGANAFAHLSYQSVSGRQQHALRLENARLRRKVTDLSVANELLLEQFALLRQSNKRAHVVAQMAESASKIMEAHNTPQPGIPLSIAQAAAAVVAAAQHSSTTPALGGVYVSSPTASNTQPTPQAVAALSAPQMHPLFTQIAPGNVLSGRIALSTPQSITAVQLHSAATPLPQTQPTAAAVILQPSQSLDFRHPGIPSFYHHPEPL